MTTTIEMLNHRLTLVLGTIALVGTGLAFMDSRHASASDVQDLTQMIRDDRVEEIEFKIEEVESRASSIMLIPVADRGERLNAELLQLKARKERYIRKLERMLGEE